MFNKGDLVSVKIEILLEEHMNMVRTLAYNPRPSIYGVVRQGNEDGGCYVSFSMDRLFNLDKDELNVDYEQIENIHLTLVKHKDDSDFGKDPYIELFFTHNGEVWNESACMPTCCHRCGGEPRSPQPPSRSSCRHMNYRNQMALM